MTVKVTRSSRLDCIDMQKGPVCAVLLAAGAARRMGSRNQHKLLADFNGVPLVKMAAQHLLSSKVKHIVVVTGFRHEDIDAAMHGLNLMILFNPDHDIGMGNSIAAGAKA